MVRIRAATPGDVPTIIGLLDASGLTAEGLEAQIATFFVAEDAGTLVGVGGLEPCGEGVGLLRSFAVPGEYRGRGIAAQLHHHVLNCARSLGIRALYLLTSSASGYFARLGFMPIARASAPRIIQCSRQFRELCPESARLMFRAVTAEDAADTTQVTAAAGIPGNGGSAHFDSGFYCAEAVLLAVATHHGINSPLLPAIATGFCSGLSRTAGLCGAVAGGVLGLNLVYGRDRPAESVEQNYAAVQRLIAEFGASCGSIQCSELLGCDLGTQEGQRTYRSRRLHERCRSYTAIATAIALSLSAGALPEPD